MKVRLLSGMYTRRLGGEVKDYRTGDEFRVTAAEFKALGGMVEVLPEDPSPPKAVPTPEERPESTTTTGTFTEDKSGDAPPAGSGTSRRKPPAPVASKGPDREPWQSDPSLPIAVGGGWWQLPNGVRVKGRDNAHKQAEELRKWQG